MLNINKAVYVIAIIILTGLSLNGQDPGFSQFFSSPLNINPALTANINTDWRIISNVRNQWIGLNSPYATGTLSYDSKITHKKSSDISETNYLGLGGMLMFDRAMSGIVKSSYGSLNLSYNITIAENDASKHRIGIGFGAIYGRRYVDFSKLDFEEQFTGSGFNTSLPTGEDFLSNMKPFISTSTGLLYSYNNERSSLDIGFAAFNINTPKQTFLEDQRQYLAIRSVAHVNVEAFINDRVVFNSNVIYQTQAKASYFSFGAALGFLLTEGEGTLINGGLWYSNKNALIPYAGIAYKDFQIGLSYDVTVSKLAQSATLSTFELSLIFRGTKRTDGNIHCPPSPWK